MSSSAPDAPTTSRRKSLLFILVITLSYVLLAEVVARLVFAVFAGSALPLAYGVDREIKFMSDSTLRHPVFYRDCEDCAGEPRPADEERASGERQLAFAFGGSTTYGANCSPSASSWPDELDALGGLRVVNMGRNGTNSDYAVAALQAVLSEHSPDVILWANWINELDILYEGPKRNQEKLAERFGGRLAARADDFAGHRVRYFLASLDRSFYEVSALYLLASKALERFQVADRIDAARGGSFDDRDAEIAIANTLINLEAAERMSRRNGFRLVIVRLPLSWPLMGERFEAEMIDFVRTWDERLLAAVTAFAEERGLLMLDLHRRLEGTIPADAYCDAAHMRLPGHRRVASAIAAMLREAAAN
jgi:hypothetical protein